MTDDANAKQTNVIEQKTQITVRLILRILVLILAITAGLWILYRLQMVLLLLVLSIFFSYLIAPLVERFEKPITIRGRSRKLPHTLAIAIVYVLLLASIVLIGYLLLPTLSAQFNDFISFLPDYGAKAKSYFEKLNLIYQYKIPPEWQDTVHSELGQVSGNLFRWIEAALLKVLSLAAFLPWLILVPILSFLMLKDAEVFRNAIVSAFPTRRLRRRIDELFSDASRTLAAYIRAQLMACVLIAVISAIGFGILGTPYPMVLGVISGVLEFIPLAGPFMTAVIATSISLTVSLKVALYVLIFLLVLRVVEDYIIYPRLIGHGLEMHPLVIILAVLSGAELGGVIGIFLAIPVTALITVCFRHWFEHRDGRGIVADLLQPAPPPPPSTEQKPAEEVPVTPKTAGDKKTEKWEQKKIRK